MENYKNKLGDLADKLKQERPRMPIQEVQPVKVNMAPKVVEVQFNNWIPKALLKRLKTYGVEHDLSLKDINIQALELFLKIPIKST
jgi:lysophospholipase L1-like esterase